MSQYKDEREMHYHPENINYVLTPGELRFANLDGEVKEVKVTAGQIIHSEEGSHIVENTGESTAETIQIEFKK